MREQCRSAQDLRLPFRQDHIAAGSCARTDEKTDFVTLSELLQHIKRSDLYINNSKEEKRKITLKSMGEFFSTNNLTMSCFKETYRPYIGGVQKGFSNVLIGYKFINNDN